MTDTGQQQQLEERVIFDAARFDPTTSPVMTTLGVNPDQPGTAEEVTEGSVTDDIPVRFNSATSAMEVCAGYNLAGRVAVVTGSNQGIGFETARTLAIHGCRVVFACRDVARGEEAVSKVRQEMSGTTLTTCTAQPDLHFIKLDLASFASIREFAQEFKAKNWPLHYLVLNAGVFGLWYSRTVDDWETTWQVNCLGHFYLVQLLQDLMADTAQTSPCYGRIVHIASETHRLMWMTKTWPSNVRSRSTLSPAHWWSYRDHYAYNVTKFVNVLTSMEMNRRFVKSGTRIRSYAVHPGFWINTGLGRHWLVYKLYFAAIKNFTKTLQQGAATSVYACVAPELEGRAMLYLNHSQPSAASRGAMDGQLAKEVWQNCEEMVKETVEKLDKDAAQA